MVHCLKRLLVIALFAFVGLGTILLYLTSGLSFYTFHALSGLMAIKHQIALCFLNGEYPLWNPWMLNGVPFHSGIGILDPFLISYLFLKGIPALIASAYLALVFAGLSMYLYLHKVWKLSIPASILGGILYLANPFFAATSHELPFMAPAVYLPLIFLFYEQGIRDRSIVRSLLCGFFLSLSFFSGNLESFYLILLFFLLIQISRIILTAIQSRSLSPAKRELIFLFLAVLSPFLFCAVDFFPTVAMIFDSGRSENPMIIQNLFYFVFIGMASVAMILGCDWLRRRQAFQTQGIKWLGVSAVIFLFAVNIDWRNSYVALSGNLFYPDIQKLMMGGVESFQLLKEAAQVPESLLAVFFKPRFVFYIQPPIYLFHLSTLFLFAFAIFFNRRSEIKTLGTLAVLFVLFPYTWVPNLNRFFLKPHDVIAYQRLMFGFFFIQSILAAYAFEKLVIDRAEWKNEIPIHRIFWVGFFISLLGLAVILKISLSSFDPTPFRDTLESFRAHFGRHEWLTLTALRGRLTLLSLEFFLSRSVWLLLWSFAKYLSILFLFLAIRFPKPVWKYGFMAFLAFEVLCGWNFYTFQKKDIRSATESFEETVFFDRIGTNERVGTIQDSTIDLINFYDEERPLEMGGNMPFFRNVRTIEGTALNLSPGRFSEFWELEPKNSYTPTILRVVPSRIYDLMGLRYLFSDFPIEDNQFRLLDKGDRYHIYENLKALPRFYFAKHVESRSENKIRKSIQKGGWDPEELTLIEDELWSDGAVERPSAEGVADISVILDRYNELTLQTASSFPAFLATTEAFHPDWNVFVDGTRRRIVETNDYFRGVFLSAGTHVVEFKYQPWSFRWGLGVSLLSGLVLIVGLFFEWKQRRGSRDVVG